MGQLPACFREHIKTRPVAPRVDNRTAERPILMFGNLGEGCLLDLEPENPAAHHELLDPAIKHADDADQPIGGEAILDRKGPPPPARGEVGGCLFAHPALPCGVELVGLVNEFHRAAERWRIDRGH